jgi:hypothetical protein
VRRLTTKPKRTHQRNVDTYLEGFRRGLRRKLSLKCEYTPVKFARSFRESGRIEGGRLLDNSPPTMFADELKALRRMGPRQVFLSLLLSSKELTNAFDIRTFQALLQALNFCNVIASGLMMWKALGLLTNTESPIVVVLRFVQVSTRVFVQIDVFVPQRIDGTCVLSWRPPLPYEPCK